MKVGKVDYTIVKTLSDDRAFSLLGRATRVFVAKDKDGNEVVIKDAWVDSSRPKEDENQRDMIRDLEMKYDDALPGELAGYFFTHLDAEEVRLTNKEVDSTEHMSRDSKGVPLKPFSTFGTTHFGRPTVRVTSSNTVGSVHGPYWSNNSRGTKQSQTYQEERTHPISHQVTRVHYRLVMKEVGVPLQNVFDPKDFLQVILQLLKRE